MGVKPDPDRWHRKFVMTAAGCWQWTGYINPVNGYGQYQAAVPGRKHLTVNAHRYVYQVIMGQIPEGLTLDHLCRNRSCVNPDHLEPVPHAENVARGDSGRNNARKTECAQGHPFDDENTRYRMKDGKVIGRVCRRCRNEASKLAQRKRRAQN